MLSHFAMEDLAGRDLVKQAVLRKPVSESARQLGEPVFKGSDDVDVYEAYK